ncbi:hypothetical protein DXD42_02305 [Collinsella sp. TM04-9]|nr:hypothetical protein DXD42_02305 [Collinsella sp. TM04-9]RGJ95045.1 hypothetical protein DXD39_03290 [Collinsella sp. TM04-29]
MWIVDSQIIAKRTRTAITVRPIPNKPKATVQYKRQFIYIIGSQIVQVRKNGFLLKGIIGSIQIKINIFRQTR